jgi:hypothetical protein
MKAFPESQISYALRDGKVKDEGLWDNGQGRIVDASKRFPGAALTRA